MMNDEHDLKQIPYGVSDFNDLKVKNLYYVDKTRNFANTILSESGELEFEKITHGEGFFRAFFNVLKWGTTDIEAPISRLFMTGVSPITLDDVTSGFNIATNISLHSDINEIMGFTQAEDQLKHYGLAEKFQKTLNRTTLKKIVLIFNGTRLVYHGEM
ncbi:MAG: AAA family ATPase [Candidatus Aminicenantes bacterium]|nr:AAA family ATPase [Candidatus Aminicenantes bacterium]